MIKRFEIVFVCDVCGKESFKLLTGEHTTIKGKNPRTKVQYRPFRIENPFDIWAKPKYRDVCYECMEKGPEFVNAEVWKAK